MNNPLTEAIKSLKLIEEEPIEYRFYYDENGRITTLSKQNHQTGDNYIVVDKSEYSNYSKYYILDGKLTKKIIKKRPIKSRLIKSDSGYKVVKNHASILLEDETYNDVEYYDYRKD